MNPEKQTFDYSGIPPGYYDNIASKKSGVRSFWHNSKFQRIIDCIGNDTESLLDIGCFAGTFLGMIPVGRVKNQVGIDILEDQVEFATQKYGCAFRKFYTVKSFKKTTFIPDNFFDFITCIEVIEHLTPEEIVELFQFAFLKLKPGGKFIITTPNYTSAWPLIEWIINRFSDVKYEEQHITRFTYFDLIDKLDKIVGGFHQKFQLDFKTTTHLLTPYIAGISFKTAEKFASRVAPSKWKLPLGSLLLLQLSKL